MKKLIYLFTLLVLSAAFVSCSKDDDNEPAYTEAQIVANWRVVESKVSESGIYTPWRLEDTGVIFMKDGDCLRYGYFGYGIGTWKLSGKVVTCYVDGKANAYYEFLNISGNTCELKLGAPGTDTKIWMRCKKMGE